MIGAVAVTAVTLHVGYGTFVPVRVDDIREHRMHEEWFSISPHTAQIVNRAKAEGRRVVAVGTTSVRTLEFAAQEDGTLTPGAGPCDIFIYPGYREHGLQLARGIPAEVVTQPWTDQADGVVTIPVGAV